MRERELLRAYRDRGDLEAWKLLIELYLPLVHAIARRFAFRGEQVEDLVQIGSIGLMKAIDRFDPRRGADLAGFAVPTIVGEIKRHLRDTGWPVRVPRRLQELSTALRTATAELTAKLERLPTVKEVAEHAGLPVELVEEALRAEEARIAVSLSDIGDDGDTGAWMTDLEVVPPFEPSVDRALLARGFRVLDERERRILHLRFFEELPQAQIAEAVGLSQIHVSRLIRRGLGKLREELAASR